MPVFRITAVVVLCGRFRTEDKYERLSDIVFLSKDLSHKRGSNMKKKTKIYLAVFAVCAALGAAAGIFAFDKIVNGPIKPIEPVSISTYDVSDFSDVCLIGHRGFSAVAPENTLISFEKACTCGFYGCEFDIHLTSDGEWVIMHDPQIKRMTSRRGVIEKMTLDSLKSIPLTNGANIEKYGEIFMPTLEEALCLLNKYNVIPVIEIKTNTTEKLDDVLSLIEKYGFSESAWIISFNKESLVRIRELDERINISLLTERVSRRALSFCTRNKLNGLDFNKDKAGEKQVKMILDAGLIPQAWTVDRAEDFERFYSFGVRYFTGNCLTY